MKNGYQRAIPEQIVIYTFARVEQFIEDYARSNKVPPHELASRVAELLHSNTGGEILRAQNQVPNVRSNGTGYREPARQMAVASQPHPDSSQMTREEQAMALYQQGFGTEHIAEQMDINPATVRAYVARANKAGLKAAFENQHTTKGRSYNGKHWTQQPKNRAKVLKRMRQLRKVGIKARWAKK